MTRLAIVAALAALGLSSLAYAQEYDEEGREVRYKARTEIDFEEVDVTGELVKPQGQLLLERKKASFNPLIRFREDFNEEMRQSIDEVK
jgi:hypothetical protein